MCSALTHRLRSELKFFAQCNMLPNLPLIAIGKTVSKISQTLNRGNGSTWPGHIALKGNPNFINDILVNSQTKVIIVAGTNGKTTTSGLIRAGLEKNGKSVIQNDSGANLLNGVASTIILNANRNGKLTQDYAIFEVDENALPQVVQQIKPSYLVLLNLFRDQLDRYGEINAIAEKWKGAVLELDDKTKIVLNADDPLIAYMGMELKHPTLFFGVDNEKTNTHDSGAADSVSCPHCGKRLTFEKIVFSHLGKWKCTACGLIQPKKQISEFPYYPLAGVYNKYNTHAASVVLKDLGINERQIINAFETFVPAFGRQEKITYEGKNVQLFLSKNPTSFNQSFATIKNLKASTVLLILNDRIPDGRDVSWIWDTDLSGLIEFNHIFVAGDRVYDMALRLKYELGMKHYEKKIITFENLKEAINQGINAVQQNETLYILPTYSAMLDARKILTGKKIL